MVDELLREIDELIRGPTNRFVDEWKRSGRPVVGYLCPYVPPEIILAAGALPLRLRGAGAEDSSLGDAFLSERVCTYVRHVMSLVLDDRYALLDGVVGANTCDHVRRSVDLFRHKTSVPYVGFVSVPRQPRESLYAYYRGELAKTYAELAEHFGTKATDAALHGAIAELNGPRRQLRRLGELRRARPCRLSGAESLAVHIAAQITPPSVFARELDRLLAALAHRPPLEEERARVVLVGAELDEPAYVRTIESQGARVVADLLCFGGRSVLDPIEHDGLDPLDALGRAYFFRPSCARMIGDFPTRWAALEQLLADVQADGIIFERLIFCDPWGADQHNLMRRTKEQGIPFLSLTREYGIVPTGQLRTRVQAFVERIEIAMQRETAR